MWDILFVSLYSGDSWMDTQREKKNCPQLDFESQKLDLGEEHP